MKQPNRTLFKIVLSVDVYKRQIQGGASMQFDMIPMNFLTAGKIGNYVVSGSFAKKALKEGKLFGATPVSYTHLDVYKRQPYGHR